VLPLDIDAWADAACQVLTDTDLWHKMSERARLAVADYNYTNAAKGILSAVRAAYDGRKKKP
jgi:glycosyltransferase involved in cell wall biosynthesis